MTPSTGRNNSHGLLMFFEQSQST